MTTITDHTAIDDGTEVTLTLATGEVTLTAAGDLVDAGATGGGVTGVALFSALEDIQKTKTDSHKYRPKFYQGVGDLGTMIDLRGGAAITTGDMKFLRNTGVRMRSGYAGDSTITYEYAGLKHGGTIGSSEQCYFKRASDTTPQNFSYTGAFDEPVLVYTNGGTDDTGGKFEVFCRTQGKTYGYYELTNEQSLTDILPVSYLIPFDTATDLKGSDTGGAIRSDAYIEANAPYTGMGPTGDGSDLYEFIAGTGFGAWTNATVYAANSVVSDGGRWYITPAGGTSSGTGVGDDSGVTDWEAYSGERSVDGTYYAFNYIIDGNSGTKEQIWEFHQYHLRNTSNIAVGETQRGDLKTAMLSWDGDTLVTSAGVFIDNVLTAEQSEYEFNDVGEVARTITFVPTFTVNIVDSDGAAANSPTGARVRIYDIDNATELYNGDPSGTSVGVNFTATGSTTIRVEWNAINGTTNASLHKETTTSMSDVANKDISIVFESNAVYLLNLVDGSAVTGVSIDAGKVDADANRASDFLSWQELYAWYCYYQNTEAGMRDSSFLINANTQTSYTTDPSFQIQNTKAGSVLVMTGAIVEDTNGSATNWADQSGYPIFSLPSAVVPFSFGSGALSAEQIALLTTAGSYDVPTVTEIREEVDSNSTQLAALVAGVNVAEMNGSAVQGDGSELNPWRGVGVGVDP